MKRRELLKSCLAAGVGVSVGPVAIAAGSAVPGIGEDRASWVVMLDRVAKPVLGALSERQLKAAMPVEAFAGREQDRRKCTYLEAAGQDSGWDCSVAGAWAAEWRRGRIAGTVLRDGSASDCGGGR